ncbi:MAG: hypothetical protein K2X27_23815 [Candidatus Obscuribacterales bacterium]|nr:hypothetical protein [Candidatus Obscuribacterales bacterium]
MSAQTPLSYRNLVIYEIYVRSHGPKGHISEVEKDLPRIKSLGVDIVWFMPIHPIGKLNAKGSMGCPYSIADYTAFNPEYGTIEDFEALIKRAHELGLKVMIDVVYNHSSHDSIYLKEHPDWYHLDAQGKPVTTVPEWSDIIDLDYGSEAAPNEKLRESLISALKQWVKLGVDGFRCDVASIVPLSFWLRARKEIAEINPDTIWLAETVHPGFIAHRRQNGLTAHSDSEVYQAFDITYDYDIFEVWRACARGKLSLEHYLEFLLQQDSIYPANYCKLRFVENHDQPRVMAFLEKREQALAWTAFSAFTPGAFLLYAGQESGARAKPSLFERESIDWKNYELQEFLSRLCQLKKDPASAGTFTIVESEPFLQALKQAKGADALYGIFNVKGSRAECKVKVPDGIYKDLLSDSEIIVKNGKLEAPKNATIIRLKEEALPFKPFVPACWHFQIE